MFYAAETRESSRAVEVGCHLARRGVKISRSFNSAVSARTLVNPYERKSATTASSSLARRAAFAFTAATASLFPTCFPFSARAPFGLPSFTPRALAAARAALVRR